MHHKFEAKEGKDMKENAGDNLLRCASLIAAFWKQSKAG